jgi:hypothetical protein
MLSAGLAAFRVGFESAETLIARADPALHRDTASGVVLTPQVAPAAALGVV